MTATNRGAKRVESDFYPTPPAFVRAILPHLPFAGSILEPMAGDGAIVRVLVAARHQCIDMIEIDPKRAEALRVAGTDSDVHIGDALAPGADWQWCFQRPEFVASMACTEKKACGWRETIPIDADRPKACPLCGAKTTCSTTDAREYGWAVFGPGRGGRLFWLDVEGA